MLLSSLFLFEDGLLPLNRDFRAGFHHCIDNLFEIFEAGGRNDNVIATTIDIFRDTEEATARIFLQRKYERLAFDLNFFRLERVLLDRRLRRHAGTIRRR